MLYNNVGLIFYGAEDVASENPENRRFGLPHCRMTPRLQGIPANIRILYWQKLRSLRYIFAAYSMRLSSFKFLWWASKKHAF